MMIIWDKQCYGKLLMRGSIEEGKGRCCGPLYRCVSEVAEIIYMVRIRRTYMVLVFRGCDFLKISIKKREAGRLGGFRAGHLDAPCKL